MAATGTYIILSRQVVKCRMVMPLKCSRDATNQCNCSINCLLGVGGAAKTHKSSLHAIASILRQEGFFGVYNGLVCLIVKK